MTAFSEQSEKREMFNTGSISVELMVGAAVSVLEIGGFNSMTMSKNFNKVRTFLKITVYSVLYLGPYMIL